MFAVSGFEHVSFQEHTAKLVLLKIYTVRVDQGVPNSS